MPWEIEKRDDQWCVIEVEDGESEGCHDTRKEALAQLAALNIAEEEKSMEKAVWSVAKINTLPDSSFFYVESGDKDDEGKTTPRTLRHFPYKDSAGKVDLPHVRNAIARAPQAKDKDGDKLSEAIVSRVQSKARAILEKEQKGVLKTVWQALLGVFGNPFKDDAVLDLSTLQKTGFVVTKDKKTGKRRWLGVPSSAFYPDREQEALSTKALTNAIDRMMESGVPTTKEGKEVILDLAHIPGVDLGMADLVGMCGPFVIASGLEGDGPMGKGFFDWAEQGPDEDMRMSIEFEYDAAQKDASGVYLDGVDIIRFTALPAAMAANPVTAFLVVDAKSEGGSAMKLDERVRPLLSEIYGEEVVTGIEGQLVEAKDAAEAAGLQAKSTESEAETPEAETETEDVAPEVLTEEALREIIGEVVAEVLGDVPGEVKALTSRLELIETARETETKAANARTRKYVFAPAEPVRKGGEPGSLSEAGIPMTSPLRQAGG